MWWTIILINSKFKILSDSNCFRLTNLFFHDSLSGRKFQETSYGYRGKFSTRWNSVRRGLLRLICWSFFSLIRIIHGNRLRWNICVLDYFKDEDEWIVKMRLEKYSEHRLEKIISAAQFSPPSNSFTLLHPIRFLWILKKSHTENLSE